MNNKMQPQLLIAAQKQHHNFMLKAGIIFKSTENYTFENRGENYSIII